MGCGLVCITQLSGHGFYPTKSFVYERRFLVFLLMINAVITAIIFRIMGSDVPLAFVTTNMLEFKNIIKEKNK